MDKTLAQQFGLLLDNLLEWYAATKTSGTEDARTNAKHQVVACREELREFLEEHAPELIEKRGPVLKGPL